MKILVVSAHPDDEIIGMGATLKKIAKNNFVKILFLADGITARKQGGFENSSKYETTENEKNIMKKEIEKRKNHAKNALKLLGVNQTKFLDLPDNELDLIPFLINPYAIALATPPAPMIRQSLLFKDKS